MNEPVKQNDEENNMVKDPWGIGRQLVLNLVVKKMEEGSSCWEKRGLMNLSFLSGTCTKRDWKFPFRLLAQTIFVVSVIYIGTQGLGCTALYCRQIP